jgi:glycosyltransferase involved in cell wall biosynthesis
MPTDVLHVLGTAQPEGSGIARIVAALASGLDTSKYHVHAWFLGSPGPLIDELRAAGATARSVPWPSGIHDPAGAYRFWRCLRNHDFAIVHQHYGARSIRRLIRLSLDARLVVHLHGGIFEPIAVHRVPIAARGADVVIAVSDAVAGRLPGPKPMVVHSGVELSRKIHPEIKPHRENIIIGAACRIVPLKGLLDLIGAVASLHPEFPRLQLEIAGTGPQREGLEREISRLGLADRVLFLGWKQDLRPTLQSWDIFALPSLDEGLPISVLEAMAEGVPVVATSVGGLPELVEHGHTGYLVPPSDVVALTKCLRQLLVDRNLRQAMGTAGRERAFDRFSLAGMVAQIEAIYDSLIAPQKSGAKR